MTSLLSRPTKTLEVSKVYHSFINYKLIFFISYLYALKWNNDMILLSQPAWWKVPSLIWLWAWVTTFRSGGRPCNLVDSIECCSFLLVGKVAHDVFISLMKLVAYLTRGHGFFKPRVQCLLTMASRLDDVSGFMSAWRGLLCDVWKEVENGGW